MGPCRARNCPVLFVFLAGLSNAGYMQLVWSSPADVVPHLGGRSLSPATADAHKPGTQISLGFFLEGLLRSPVALKVPEGAYGPYRPYRAL